MGLWVFELRSVLLWFIRAFRFRALGLRELELTFFGPVGGLHGPLQQNGKAISLPPSSCLKSWSPAPGPAHFAYPECVVV